MRSLKLIAVSIFIACLLPVTASAAEPAQPESNGPSAIGTMPSRGMTMDEVRKHFGEPDKVVQPIGKPPITRWIYNDGFVVFFEHKYVLHALVPVEDSK